jgi:Domain of unknown function (DUF4442)
MLTNVKKINRFLLLKLPSAFLCGVRLRSLNTTTAVVTVTHRWINQNPFNSMYFAVQSMASELSTGAMIMQKISQSKATINMLVTNHKGVFTKKATGKITFTCYDGAKIDEAISQTLKDGEWQKITLKSVGVNAEGIEVSQYAYEWSLRARLN